jgi:hypothetical protein
MSNPTSAWCLVNDWFLSPCCYEQLLRTENKVVYLTSTISWTFGVVVFAFWDFDKSTHVPKTVGRSHTRLKLPFATFPERWEKNEYFMHKSLREIVHLFWFLGHLHQMNAPHYSLQSRCNLATSSHLYSLLDPEHSHGEFSSQKEHQSLIEVHSLQQTAETGEKTHTTPYQVMNIVSHRNHYEILCLGHWQTQTLPVPIWTKHLFQEPPESTAMKSSQSTNLFDSKV